MPQYPGIGFPPDSETSLWRDFSRNLFEMAQAHGYSLLLEPNGLDSATSAARKATYYSAYILEN